MSATVITLPEDRFEAPIVPEDENTGICSCCYNKVARAHNRLLAENELLRKAVAELRGEKARK